MSQPERLSTDELRTLFLFEELNEEQLDWLAAHGRVVEYPAGATIHPEGGPASCLFMLLSGTLAMSRRVQGGELEVHRSDTRGSYTGAFDFDLGRAGRPSPLSGDCARRGGLQDVRASRGRARQGIQALVPDGGAPPARLRNPGHEHPGNDREARAAGCSRHGHGRPDTRAEQPCRCRMRASSRLREMLAEMREKLGLLVQAQLPGDKLETVAELAAAALESRRQAPRLSLIEASDREDEVATWLADHEIATEWDIAATLVSAGLGIDWLEELIKVTPPPHLEYGLSYPVRAIESDNLLDEITDGAERISGLLASARQYTQMDRAPRRPSTCTRGSTPR